MKVALDFDRLVAHGAPGEEAIAQLHQNPEIYDQEIVAALEDMEVRPPANRLRALPVQQLDAYMVLDEDVYAKNGNLLVTKGQELTFPILERLRRWGQGVGVKEPIRVLIPHHTAKAKSPGVGAAT